MRLVRSFIIFLLIPTFLDVVSCQTKTFELDIYYYTKEEYQLEKKIKKIYRNTELELSEYDYPILEDHQFLGWIALKNIAKIKTFEDLEEVSSNYQIVELLPKRVSRNIAYYPIMIPNNQIQTFKETSKLANVNVTLNKIFINHEKIENFKGTLLDTYQETLKFNIEEEGYNLIGCFIFNSFQQYSYDDVIKNQDKLNFLDLEKKIEFTNNLEILAYYEEKL